MIEYLILIFAMISAYSSWYNTFLIQKPWYKDYNNTKEEIVDYTVEPSTRKL